MFEELGPKFEERLLSVTARFAESELQLESDSTNINVSLLLVDGEEVLIPYETSWTYSTMVEIDEQEILKWKNAYTWDPHFNLVCRSKEEDEKVNITFPQHHYSKEGLIYFVDSMGNTRLCVPKDLRVKVMQEAHYYNQGSAQRLF